MKKIEKVGDQRNRNQSLHQKGLDQEERFHYEAGGETKKFDSNKDASEVRD